MQLRAGCKGRHHSWFVYLLSQWAHKGKKNSRLREKYKAESVVLSALGLRTDRRGRLSPHFPLEPFLSERRVLFRAEGQAGQGLGVLGDDRIQLVGIEPQGFHDGGRDLPGLDLIVERGSLDFAGWPELGNAGEFVSGYGFSHTDEAGPD